MWSITTGILYNSNTDFSTTFFIGAPCCGGWTLMYFPSPRSKWFGLPDLCGRRLTLIWKSCLYSPGQSDLICHPWALPPFRSSASNRWNSWYSVTPSSGDGNTGFGLVLQQQQHKPILLVKKMEVGLKTIKTWQTENVCLALGFFASSNLFGGRN